MNSMKIAKKRIGVFALQGSFVEHVAMVKKLGHDAREIRSMEDIKQIDPRAIILPGGESTTMMNFLKENELMHWLKGYAKAGMPIFATCAGLILLSKSHLDVLDVEVDRNAYGSQLDSFETDIKINLPTPDSQLHTISFHALFIRAPKIKKIGSKVIILAEAGAGNPVLVQQKNILGATFHPELTDDTRIHRYFINLI